MSILVYGFEKFRNYPDNITEKIIRQLPPQKNIIPVVFPVLFDKNQFLQAVITHQPQIIIGMGQCRRGNQIRIERKALNRMRDQKEQDLEPISLTGSAHLFLPWKPDRCSLSRYSYDAGTYVCNFSMYVLTEYSMKHRIKYAFFHVPMGFKLDEAVRYIGNFLKFLQK